MKSCTVALCLVLGLGCESSGSTNWLEGTDFSGKGKAAMHFPIDTCTHDNLSGPVLLLSIVFDSYLDPTYSGNFLCDYGKYSKGINAVIWRFAASGAIAPGSYAQHLDSTGGAYVERWTVDASCTAIGPMVRADSSTVTIVTNDSTHVVGTLSASFGSEKITLEFDAPLEDPVLSVCQALKYTGGTNGPGCPASLCLP
jgi:hypothetical protein